MHLDQEDNDVSEGSRMRRRMLSGVVVLGSLALVAGGIAALHARAAAVPEATANPPITVATTAVTFQSSYRIEDDYIGRIEATRRTEMGFELRGLVTDVLVEEGERVEAGQPIASLDTDRLISVRDGLTAERQQTEARRNLAQATLKRQRELRTEGWQTEQRYDEARYLVAELTASIKRIEASIESITIDIDKSTIYAPFDGVVGRRLIDEGAVVSPGTSIVEVFESGRKQARIGVPVAAAEALVVGDLHQLTVDGRQMDAVLRAKRPDLQTGTLTVAAVFEFASAHDGLFDGDVVVLRLPRQVDEPGAWLPMTALTEGRKGVWTVFAVHSGSAGQVVKREAVEVLHVSDTDVYVRGTLREGDRVVLGGTHRVVPGQRVSLKVEGD